MTSEISLREVFTPGGLPSITYVGRDQLKLEKSLEEGLARGYTFIVVTGPTKSGKTVLCKKVLNKRKIVTIEGGQVRSENDFWSHVAYQLQIAATAARTHADSFSVSVATEASGGVPGIIQGKGGATKTEIDQKISTLTYTNVSILACIQHLLETNSVLLVDDFHYMDSSLQKAIIRSLKGPVFEGLSVVLLAVPHRAFDPVLVEQEIEGRFKHIAIPNWALNDLALIPERGFAALNVIVERAVQRRICEDSFSNPLLVQEICSEFCLKCGVFTAQDSKRELKANSLEETYRNMAESKGIPVYQKLRRGPEGGRARRLHRVRSGGQVDIYGALLASIARLGPKSTTSLTDIRDSLRSFIADDVPVPTRADVVNCLNNMSDLATKMGCEPPLEWIPEDQRLEIIDPFLLFSLKWSHQ